MSRRVPFPFCFRQKGATYQFLCEKPMCDGGVPPPVPPACCDLLDE